MARTHYSSLFSIIQQTVTPESTWTDQENLLKEIANSKNLIASSWKLHSSLHIRTAAEWVD